jgi:asparagine synthetase B (glutamine-hydrolysing)
MKSSNFGEEVIYYQENNFQNKSKNLRDLIFKNGFTNFSPAGITSYLTFRYPIEDLTMFNGYKKVPCGCKEENKKIIIEWYPKFEERRIFFEKAKERIRELLIESIKNLTEGKKIAIPLSGGVDSSMILALTREIYPNKKIYTYSAGFYGDDEFEYSRLAAKIFNSIHKEKILYKEDYIGKNSLLRPLIRQKGEPLHPNEIALAEVEKIAKQDGCEVALCGEGADDIFGGYGQNLRMYINYRKDIPFFKFFLSNYRYFSLEDRKKIIKDEYLVDDFKLVSLFLDEKEMPEDIRNKVFYFTQKIHTPGLIMRGANAMRFNYLETGFPYLDSELVNFVNSLPFEYKLHWKSKKHEKLAENMYFRDISEKMDIPKYILKKIVEKYLPRKIIYRPKKGFPVPFDKWFADLKEWPLDKEIFKFNDISSFNGWKKFMIINLNTFVEEFSKYKK